MKDYKPNWQDPSDAYRCLKSIETHGDGQLELGDRILLAYLSGSVLRFGRLSVLETLGAIHYKNPRFVAILIDEQDSVLDVFPYDAAFWSSTILKKLGLTYPEAEGELLARLKLPPWPRHEEPNKEYAELTNAPPLRRIKGGWLWSTCSLAAIGGRTPTRATPPR